jgi:hypothetical protein
VTVTVRLDRLGPYQPIAVPKNTAQRVPQSTGSVPRIGLGIANIHPDRIGPNRVRRAVASNSATVSIRARPLSFPAGIRVGFIVGLAGIFLSFFLSLIYAVAP